MTSDTAHLHTPETRARNAAARSATARLPRPTTSPGSETTQWTPGQPVRVTRLGVSSQYKRRTGWVGVVSTQRFPDGRQYTEIGVTWSLHTDWAKASADTWFRVDELEAR